MDNRKKIKLSPSDDFDRGEVVRNGYINYLRGISTQKGLDLINYYVQL